MRDQPPHPCEKIAKFEFSELLSYYVGVLDNNIKEMELIITTLKMLSTCNIAVHITAKFLWKT
jgi:hypothetical protein